MALLIINLIISMIKLLSILISQQEISGGISFIIIIVTCQWVASLLLKDTNINIVSPHLT